MEDFNSYFTKLRKSQGLTQEQFAQKLGISRSLVAKIEANKQDVTKKVKEKLHNVFPGSVFFTQNPDNIPAPPCPASVYRFCPCRVYQWNRGFEWR